MDHEEYFQRVVRFLETKGWNTSTSQLTETTYIVTGTRESDTYYDRMLTMVAVDETTALTAEHMEFLVDAADENDVDQMMATGRSGLDDEARQLATEYDIQFIEPATIDDAFIDDFSVDEGSMLGGASFGDGFQGGAVAHQITSLLGLYLIVGVGLGICVVTIELATTDGSSLSVDLVRGAVLLVSPLLAAVGGGVLFQERSVSPIAGFLGAGIGSLLVFFVLGVTVALFGLVGDAGLYSPTIHAVAVIALAVPVGLIGAGTASLSNRQLK